MRERFEKIWAQSKEQLNKLSKKTKIIIGIGLVVVLVFALVVALILNNKDYVVLFPGLNEQETTEISAKLQEAAVPYKISDGTIYVLDTQVDQIKASLVSQGYPKSGLTYDIFTTNVDLMTTDFEKQTYKLYDLQERLSATIRQFDNVKDATVSIALGDQKKYVLEKDKIESSASVTVITYDNNSPTPDQVKGIQRLVAYSVPGMKMTNVVVLDSNGNDVSNDVQNSQTGSIQLKRNLETEIENSTKAKVMNLLMPAFGEDYVRVTVNATVDVDKKIKEIINYIPSAAGNTGVLSSETQGVEQITGAAMTGGVPGSETNADIPVYPGVTYNGGELYFKDEKSLDYLVSQVKEQVQSDAGVLTNLTVSVAVDSDQLNARQITDLKNLIANAAGIDLAQVDNKIAIFSTKFYSPPATTTNNLLADLAANPLKYIWFIVGAAALLIVFIVLLILILKKKKAEAIEEEAKALEEGIMSIDLEGIRESREAEDIKEIKPTRETELKAQIREFVGNNPEISAQLLKTWLRGGEGND